MGFSNLKLNGFEPKYNCYKEYNKEKLIVRIEAPGNVSIESKIEYIGEFTIIKIKGNKGKDRIPENFDDNLYNIREFGFFSFEIPLKTEEFLIENNDPIIMEKKGLPIIEYYGK